MAVFRAFYDTSGHPSSPPATSAFVTAGLLASDKQWVGFERDWALLMKEFGVEFLHMREMRNTFAGRPDEAAALLRRALQILRRRMTRTLVVSVIPRDFNAVNAAYQLDRVLQTPHQCSVGTCVMLGHLWFSGKLNQDARHEITHWHEAGEINIGMAQEFAERHGATLNTRPSRDASGYVGAFQAADFIAWEIRRLWEQLLQERLQPTRESLVDITYGLVKEVHMWQEESLRELCVENNIPRRIAPRVTPS